MAILDRLHAAQNEFCGGGNDRALRALLDQDIRWFVALARSLALTAPALTDGTASISGTHTPGRPSGSTTSPTTR
jgi:hypothetical protein